MKDFKDDITNADAIKLISDAVSDTCGYTCDTCKCTEWCDYYKALQKVKIALSVAYVCKGSGADYPCQHTTDITKAKNFTETDNGAFIEKTDISGEWIDADKLLNELESLVVGGKDAIIDEQNSDNHDTWLHGVWSAYRTVLELKEGEAE